MSNDDTPASDQGQAPTAYLAHTVGGPVHEITPTPADKQLMDNYNAVIQAQEAKIQECKNTAAQRIANDQAAIDQLDNDIADDKQQIAADSGDKSKRAADYKKLRADQRKLAAKKRDLKQSLHIKCPSLKTNLACVPANKKSIRAPMTATQQTALNNQYNTNIDLNKVLVDAEGGNYGDAYVPFRPDVKVDANGDPVYTVDQNNQVLGVKMTAGRDSSGITIGSAVDLGGKNKNAYFKDIDSANKKYGILSPAELESLKNKLSPYMGLRRARACQLLMNQRKNPNASDADKLENLSDDELALINSQSVEDHMDSTKRAYNRITNGGNFSNLTAAQQTILFSENYQGSKLFHDTAQQYGSGNASYDPDGREHGWINQ